MLKKNKRMTEEDKCQIIYELCCNSKLQITRESGLIIEELKKYGFETKALEEKMKSWLKWKDYGNLTDHFDFSESPPSYSDFEVKVIGIDIPMLVKPKKGKPQIKIALIGQAPNRRGSDFEVCTEFKTKKVVIGPAYGVGSKDIIEKRTFFYARIIRGLLEAGCQIYLSDVSKIFIILGNDTKHWPINFTILNDELKFLKKDKYKIITFGNVAKELLGGSGISTDNIVSLKHFSWDNRAHEDILSDLKTKIEEMKWLTRKIVFS
jgi:hypothetical protein